MRVIFLSVVFSLLIFFLFFVLYFFLVIYISCCIKSTSLYLSDSFTICLKVFGIDSVDYILSLSWTTKSYSLPYYFPVFILKSSYFNHVDLSTEFNAAFDDFKYLLLILFNQILMCNYFSS